MDDDEQPRGEPGERGEFMPGYEPGRGRHVNGESEQRDVEVLPPNRGVVDHDRGDAAAPIEDDVPPVYRDRRSSPELASAATPSDNTAVDRRIVHFRGYHETRFGRTRFTEVVTIVPAEHSWVGFTIDPKTRLWMIRAQYLPASDPFELLQHSEDPYVVDTYLRRSTKRRGIWRCTIGYREPPKHPDVWLCKRLLNIEISKASTPADLYEYLAGHRPNAARTRRQAAARCGRAMLSELVDP